MILLKIITKLEIYNSFKFEGYYLNSNLINYIISNNIKCPELKKKIN